MPRGHTSTTQASAVTKKRVPAPSAGKDTTLRLKTLSVVQLFHLYDHTIDLHLDERITIIHGPNGVGKTVLLTMLAAIFQGKYYELVRYPFLTLDLTFVDGSVLNIETLETTKDQIAPDATPGLRISLKTPTEMPQPFVYEWNRAAFSSVIAQAEPFLPIHRQTADLWYDQLANETVSTVEVFERYYDSFPDALRQQLTPEPEWMASLRERLPVYFIETQRLLDFVRNRAARTRAGIQDRTPFTYAVRSIAADLAQRISQTTQLYAMRSQALDQSFPRRLLTESVNTYSVDDLRNWMSKLDDTRTKFRRLGILGEETDYPLEKETLEKVGDQERKVMTFYVEDSMAKLEPLQDLFNRTSLLLNIVNAKFNHKTVEVSRQHGFVVTDDKGRSLALNNLSSGEQHELVLAYSLLFKVRANSLVLIDEPELSLHIEWQTAFLNDLLEIVKNSHFDVILATHSPNIVGTHDDLMVTLSGTVS